MSGLLFIVSAPSGAGKSRLVNELLAADRHVRLSISHTTRAPRPGEEDGREYHFVSRETFTAMVAAGQFVEHAEVYGNLYGTSKGAIAAPLAAGEDIVLEIDWQGAAQVRAKFGDAAGIFILPPSLDVLEVRLRARGQDNAESIARRLAAAREDMSHFREFDYVIINLDLSDAIADLVAIVRSARLARTQQELKHASLIQQLL